MLKRRTVFLTTSATLLAVAAMAAPAASGAHTPAPPAKSKSALPAAKGPITSFPQRIQTLGASYKNSYGGQEVSPSGSLVIYVTSADFARFQTAISREETANQIEHYTLVKVANSWAQLNQLTDLIAKQEPRWRAQGIDLAKWGPEAASNKVDISLKNYTPAAASKLEQAYGSNMIAVSDHSLNEKLFLRTRYFDTIPFYGGDAIYFDPQNAVTICTSGFTTLGNVNPSNHFLLTAGHCGTENPWYTNYTGHISMGPTSTNYWDGAGGTTSTDVQGIGPNQSWGDVWGNGTTIYNPNSTYQPAANERITFDGATTGEVNNVPVYNSGPFCRPISGHNICNLGEAKSTNGVEICLGGDSGGPVFQRIAGGNYVKAVGLIEASNQAGTDCFYTLIGPALSISNVHLDTNPTG